MSQTTEAAQGQYEQLGGNVSNCIGSNLGKEVRGSSRMGPYLLVGASDFQYHLSTEGSKTCGKFTVVSV